MTKDTSRFTHGAIYHSLFDRPLADVRKVVVDLVPEESTVLDIACGTGELCFELRAQKKCRVVGVDLSRRMIDFANKRNRYDDVTFVQRDGCDLSGLEPSVFDHATVLFVLHEVPREKQVQLLKEALRVARRVVVVDSRAPLPRSLHGMALRLVEALGGPAHYRRFAEYLALGGIPCILADSRLKATVLHRCIFWHNCREVFVLSG